MEKQHNKNNILSRSPITYWAYWKDITKVLTMAAPIAFVVLGVLAFSSCAEKKTNDIATADTATPGVDGGDGDGGTGGDGGTDPVVPVCTWQAGDEFVSKWTAAANESIKLPLVSKSNGGEYDFTVDWGDGSTETINATTLNIADDTTAPNVTHEYTIAGTFEVKITGTITGWQFGYGNSYAAKLVEISSFGPLDFGPTDGKQFYGTENLEVTATDAPGLCNTTNLNFALQNSKAFNADISSWDVSAVTTMNSMFRGATAFNNGGAALSWGSGVSKVTNMNSMFYSATDFNADISGWDVSAVTDMRYMFFGTEAFNQPLNGWDVSAVTNMSYMFRSAKAFNANISGWDVSSVTTMKAMFSGATVFNNGGAPLSWGSTVANVTTMEEMFRGATAFNNGAAKGVSTAFSWGSDVFKVTTMKHMFQYATSFNADISSWDVSSVAIMQDMFNNATDFNNGGAALSWGSTVANVTTMQNMFYGATSFNADISSWDVSSVAIMQDMFNNATDFNNGGAALSWGSTVANVTTMQNMFQNAKAFNADISSWDVSSVTDMNFMFVNATDFNNGGVALSWGVNVSAVTDMHYMFYNATAFNADISGWDVSAVTDMTSMFGKAIAFDKDLNSWDARITTTPQCTAIFSDATLMLATPGNIPPKLRGCYYS